MLLILLTPGHGGRSSGEPPGPGRCHAAGGTGTAHTSLSTQHGTLGSGRSSDKGPSWSSRSLGARCRNSIASCPEEQPHVGNYRLLRTIGKGNFAKVKLARHILTGREVSGAGGGRAARGRLGHAVKAGPGRPPLLRLKRRFALVLTHDLAVWPWLS